MDRTPSGHTYWTRYHQGMHTGHLEAGGGVRVGVRGGVKFKVRVRVRVEIILGVGFRVQPFSLSVYSGLSHQRRVERFEVNGNGFRSIIDVSRALL